MKSDTLRHIAGSYPAQLYVLGSSIALPWVALHLWEAWVCPIPIVHRPIIYLLATSANIVAGTALWRRCHEPFQNLANLVRSLQQEDYSRRAIPVSTDDPLDLLYYEINTLADTLQENRLSNAEQTHRFQSLIDHVEVAVLAFSESGQVMMANLQACRLYGRSASAMLDLRAADYQLDALMTSPSGSMHTLSFPTRTSRYLLHRTDFREHGRPCRLIVLTDLSSPLREEERTAWKRLIRVLGHELNNSLTPILSITDSVARRLSHSSLPDEERQGYQEALRMVGTRADNLRRFVKDYSELAKLPAPKPQSVPVARLVDRAAAMCPAARVHVEGGTDCNLWADGPQVEQALINLIRNAIEATDLPHGRVTIHWTRETTRLLLRVDDNGPGISEPGNLFVPFYSTKPGGSGIGLVLSRQIAEANGGTLTLDNREEGGCRAELMLPLDLGK